MVQEFERELVFERVLRRGDEGEAVARLQEWLDLADFGTRIDGAFGPVTEAALADFQAAEGLQPHGRLDPETQQALTAPFRRVLAALAPLEGEGLRGLALRNARRHLAERPREVGGRNCGPWIRLYMRGNDGPAMAWCAGFLRCVLQQAAAALALDDDALPVFPGFAVDDLARSAQQRHGFRASADLPLGPDKIPELPPGSLFLLRARPEHWLHAGFVERPGAEFFRSIEGNALPEGGIEGVGVFARYRGYRQTDFVVY